MSLRIFRQNGRTQELNPSKLENDKIEALENQTRRKILEKISGNPSYPSEIAKKLGISKQKAYYHFEKLLEADIIEKIGEEELSGGKAKIHSVKSDALYYDLHGEGKKTFLPPEKGSAKSFLHPFIKDGKINGKIVVGSPEIHGEDRVRALDGHLAGELAAKIGNYGEISGNIVEMDTSLEREKTPEGNLLILGGILTNTASKRFNGAFPVEFKGESFPYRVAEAPDSEYEDLDIGFVSKARNPEDESSWIYLVAGIGRRGTRGAVKAFQDLEEIVEGYGSGEFLKTVRALDSDGDGEIDDYELVV